MERFSLSSAGTGLNWSKAQFETGRISVTPLRTPLSIPQIAWISGIGLALVMWLLIALRVAGNVLHRNWDAISELIGSEDIESEIKAELVETEDQS